MILKGMKYLSFFYFLLISLHFLFFTFTSITKFQGIENLHGKCALDSNNSQQQNVNANCDNIVKLKQIFKRK